MTFKPDDDRSLAFTSLEDLQAVIDAYFADADAKGDPYIITGLACALGTNREALLENRFVFADTVSSEVKRLCADAVKRAKVKIHAWAEKYLYAGKNQVSGIFALKCNWGWRDVQEVEISGPGGGPILMIHRAAQQALEQSPTQQAIELADDYDPLA